MGTESKLPGQMADPSGAQAGSTAKTTSTLRLLPGGEGKGLAGYPRAYPDIWLPRSTAEKQSLAEGAPVPATPEGGTASPAAAS